MSDSPRPAAWPLLFTYRGPIFGNGFLASVELCGRLLASVEVDGVWLNGVNPGAFAVGARTFTEANCSLRDALTRVFLDVASDSQSFGAFQAEIKRFYEEVDESTEAEWEEARQLLADGIVAPPEGLPRKPEGLSPFLKVEEKVASQVTPADNAPTCAQHDQVLATAA